MPTPKEILDERLAKGEIDETEYERLLARMSAKDDDVNKTKVEQPKAAPPQPQTEGLSPQQEKILANVVKAAAVYLAICFVILFAYPPSSMRQSTLERCGSRSAFCQCQAGNAVEARNFFIFPLQVLGVVSFPSVANGCHHLQ